MMNKHKEIVTTKQIQIDYIKNAFVYVIELTTIVALLVIVGIHCVIFIANGRWLWLVPAFGWLMSYLFWVFYRVYTYWQIKQGNYTIEQDVLIQTNDRFLLERFGYFYKENKLRFRSCGEWKLPEGSYYTWSKYYSTNSDGVERRAVVGEEYTVVLRGKKIIMAYNNKCFEYRE